MTNFLKKVAVAGSTIAMVASMALVNVATVSAASAGEVYKTTDGTVWFITKDMEKRPFTSSGAFLSYGFLSFSQVKDADSTVTALPTGSFIAPQDGRIFCATETKGTDVKGECSLVTGGMKAAFTSSAVFTGQGFSFSRAFYGDSSFLSKTSNVDSASAQHRAGTLINNGGTVQLVVSGGLWGVPSESVFNSWGWSYSDVVPANSADTSLSQTGVIPSRMAGDLVPTATDDNEPTGDCNNLSGSAGSITVSPLSDYSGEEVGEGESEVPIMSFEVEADNDSDVAVRSVKVEFDENGAGSTDLDDYASEVVVMLDGDVVGSADVSDFTETSTNGTWTKTISLDCAMVEADSTGDFTIGVDGNNTIDSNDQDEAWIVDVLNVRFEDGDGVTTTEETDTAALEKTFTWTSFAGASDIELRASLTDDADEINDAHVIDIDDTDDTNDAEILAFSLENRGDVDITVNDIPVVITTTGETNEATLLLKATLWNDGDKIGSESMVDGGALVFDDLDFAIDAGDTADFVVAVDIQDTTGAADNGDTVQATLTVASIDADDSQGDTIAGGDLTGAASGGTHGLYDAGITVDFVSATATNDPSGITGVADTVNMTIVFDVTAFDTDAFVDASAITDEAGGATYQDILVNGAVGTGVLTSDADTAANSTYRVREGQTERFTLSMSAPGNDAFVQGVLESVLWATTAIDGDQVYNFNMGDYHTDYVYSNNNT